MIVGSIIGLLGSLIPEAIKIVKDWSDKKFEKEMYELKMKYAEQETKLRIEEARAIAETELDKKVYDFAKTKDIVRTGSPFADTLQVLGNFLIQSVRPILTYILIGFYVVLKISMWKTMGGNLNAVPLVFGKGDEEFIAACVFFWFGNRSLYRARRGY